MKTKSTLFGLAGVLATALTGQAHSQTFPPTNLPDYGGRLGVSFNTGYQGSDQPVCLEVVGVAKKSALFGAIEAGDCIYGVNGYNIRNVQDVVSIVGSDPAGTEFTVSYRDYNQAGFPAYVMKVSSVSIGDLAVKSAEVDYTFIAQTDAERQFQGRATGSGTDGLMETLSASYANYMQPDNERYAAGMYVLDLLALQAEASRDSIGLISSIGGFPLETPVYVANHKKFFDYTFGVLGGSAKHRREWQGKEVVVAASYPGCQVSGAFVKRGENGPLVGFAADYVFGWMDPSNPNAFFKLALSPGNDAGRLSAQAAYAESWCKETRASIGIAMPIFVVSGFIHCYDNCESRYEFIVDRISYSYRGAGFLDMVVNTTGTTGDIKDALAPLGIR